MKKIVCSGGVFIGGRFFKVPVSKGGVGHYLEILNCVVGQVDAMLSHHSKLIIFRLDFHLDNGSFDNTVMSKLIRRYRKWVKSKGYLRLGFVWGREQNNVASQHYHCAFILDGNKLKHPGFHIKKIQQIWQSVQDGFVYIPKNCFYVLKRGDDKEYQKLFDRLSYIAKVATKNNRKATTNDYSGSRIKNREVSLQSQDNYFD